MNVHQGLGPARRHLSAAALFFGLMSTGCTTSVYTYRPAGNVGATVSGLPAAHYPLPPEQPTGALQVASPGVDDVDSDDGEFPALRARLVVANDAGDVPWALDVRDVHAEIGASGAQHPAFVNAAEEDMPIVSIPRGKERTVDVFFWLPEEVPGEESLPSFTVRWKVRTGAAEHEGRTTFERVEVVDRAPPPAFAYAPYWWYDPLFYGSPFHMGGPWGPSLYWGSGFSFGATWNAPLIQPVPPVRSDRIPATPGILAPNRMHVSPGLSSPSRSFTPPRPSIVPRPSFGGPRGRR
jgi:hypothetical protein